ARRPKAEWNPDFPLVAEGIDDPTETPTVFVADGRHDARAGRDRLLDDRLGIIDDEQRAACRAVDRTRTEALHLSRARCNPERRVPDGELSDDVVSVAHAVKDGCAERGFIERDRFAWSVDPQLWLNAAHR